MTHRPLKPLSERLNRHQLVNRELKMKQRRLQEDAAKTLSKLQENSKKRVNKGVLQRIWRWLCQLKNKLLK